MINNLEDYFLQEQEFYLQEISYKRIENDMIRQEHSLNCTDNIKVDIINDDRVRVTVIRTLKFDPEELFNLSVSFGAILRFNQENKADYCWEEINLAEEFRNHGEFVIGNLMGRISLQIAQITSSFGQSPLILPANVVKSN